MTITYSTTFLGDQYRLRANWANASSPIERATEDGWRWTGWQVATFGHESTTAMRTELEEVVWASGDDPSEESMVKAINQAVRTMHRE